MARQKDRHRNGRKVDEQMDCHSNKHADNLTDTLLGRQTQREIARWLVIVVRG